MKKNLPPFSDKPKNIQESKESHLRYLNTNKMKNKKKLFNKIKFNKMNFKLFKILAGSAKAGLNILLIIPLENQAT